MAIQPHFLGSMTLKALLEDPNLKNPPLLVQSNDQIKVKKEDGQPQINYGSAFLGGNLWDKPCGDMDFNLQYMDLDEFLSENNIEEPVPTTDAQTTHVQSEESLAPSNSELSLHLPKTSNDPDYLRTPPLISPSQFLVHKASSSADPQYSQHSIHSNITQHSCTSPPQSVSPNPGSPILVDYEVSQQDLALSSIPGEGEFDPTRKQFSEEELKPQPIIKKSKKVFVPEDLKDDKYWARRHKNNYAAKRSRDARRVKENQIAMRANFLEKENSVLREEVNKLRKENAKLRSSKNKTEYVAPPELPLIAPSSPLSITALAFS